MDGGNNVVREIFATDAACTTTTAVYYPASTGVDVSTVETINFFTSLTKTGSPTSVQFTPQTSDDLTNWYDYKASPFDAWIYSGSAIGTGKKDAGFVMKKGEFVGTRLRVKVVGTGVDATTNYITTTMSALLRRAERG